MTKAEALEYIKALKWLNEYQRATLDGKPIEEILDGIAELLKDEEDK